ncbi:MAG: site-specific DNA-methyltransferase [Boseongicola sp.]|nr:site-specific DNA-methyltransferase [Boseongicola sp.]
MSTASPIRKQKCSPTETAPSNRISRKWPAETSAHHGGRSTSLAKIRDRATDVRHCKHGNTGAEYVKPFALVRDAAMVCSNRGGIVLDSFAGSGSTLVAAHYSGKRGFGIDLDSEYCDVIFRQTARVRGLKAYHTDGRAFEVLNRTD